MIQNPLRYISDRKADLTRLLLSFVFIALVFFPLITMFTYVDGDSLKKVFTAPNFGTVVANSLISTTISTVITLVLAYALAVCVERTRSVTILWRFLSICQIACLSPQQTATTEFPLPCLTVWKS